MVQVKTDRVVSLARQKEVIVNWRPALFTQQKVKSTLPTLATRDGLQNGLVSHNKPQMRDGFRTNFENTS